MARKKKTPAKPLLGAEQFAGADADREAIEKIAAARAAAEQEKAGDNGGPLMDEAAWERAVNQLMAEQIDIEAMMEQVAEARGRISSIRKVAKSCGVDWDVVKVYATYQKRIRKGETGAIVTEHRRLGALMKHLNCPLYTQFALFPEEAKPANGKAAPAGMDAELQGQHAHSNGEPRDNNPFQAGTQDHVDWSQGWANAERGFLNPPNGSGAPAH
jgi:hypothetical protein